MPPKKKSSYSAVLSGLTFCVSGDFVRSQSELKNLLFEQGKEMEEEYPKTKATKAKLRISSIFSVFLLCSAAGLQTVSAGTNCPGYPNEGTNGGWGTCTNGAPVGFTCSITCNAGYYLTSTTGGLTTCTSSGWIAPQVCNPCPAGTYSNTWGTTQNQTICQPCPSCGTSQPGATSCSCQGYPPNGGTFGNNGGWGTCTNGAASGFSCSITCNPGYYLTGSISFCNNGIWNGTQVCNPCPANTYSIGGQSVCTPCSSGTCSTAIGATSSATCVTCASCVGYPPEGANGGWGNCTNGAASGFTCSITCNAGYYLTSTGTGGPTTCNNGVWNAPQVCNPCPAGTYSSTWGTTQGQSICQPCPTGTTTSIGVTGATSSAACISYQPITAVCAVSTIAQLRSLSKSTWSMATVMGYYSSGDGGGGQYFVDLTDTTSPDNGGTILVASDGGRWKLQIIGGRVTAKQFGVKGDGVTDDTVNVQAAIASLKNTGGTIDFSDCVTIKISSTITIGNGSNTAASTVHNIFLVGGGGTSAFLNSRVGTTLLWSGPSGGTMMQFLGPMTGGGLLGGWTFDGVNGAARGLVINDLEGGQFPRLTIKNCAGAFLTLTTQGDANTVGGCRQNKFGIYAATLVQSGGIGLLLDGSTGPVLQNVFDQVDIRMSGYGAIGIQIGSSDFNLFNVVDITRVQDLSYAYTSVGVMFTRGSLTKFQLLAAGGGISSPLWYACGSVWSNLIDLLDGPDTDPQGGVLPTAKGVSGYYFSGWATNPTHFAN